MVELMPCPFCGGVGHPIDRGEDAIVECGSCGCEMTGLTLQNAIGMWNERPDEQLRIALIAIEAATREYGLLGTRSALQQLRNKVSDIARDALLDAHRRKG